MIDFQSIRHTTAGLECCYLGQRRSGDQVLHRFAVVNPAGETFQYYNDQGQRIEFDDRTGKWVATPTGHQIIAPPKIVEVTRWLGYYWDKDKGDVCTDCYVQIYPDAERAYLKLLKITESIEVPNE